jgi:hypothetical protein
MLRDHFAANFSCEAVIRSAVGHWLVQSFEDVRDYVDPLIF